MGRDTRHHAKTAGGGTGASGDGATPGKGTQIDQTYGGAHAKGTSAAAEQEAVDAIDFLDGELTGALYSWDMVGPHYRGAVGMVIDAIHGKQDDQPLDPIARADRFDAGVRALGPAIEIVRGVRPDLTSDLLPRLEHRRDDLQLAKAEARMARLDGAMAAPDPKRPPEEQARDLRPIVARTVELAKTMSGVFDEAANDLEPDVRRELFEAKQGKGGLALGALTDALGLAQSLLALDPDELAKQLDKLNGGPLATVQSMSDLLAKTGELVEQTVGLLAKSGALVANAAGKSDLALQLSGVAEHVGNTLGAAVAALEIVHGASVLLDREAGDEEKADAVVEVGAGAATLAGLAGVAGAGPAGTAVAITWELAKWVADGIVSTSDAIVEGYMKRALDDMMGTATTIVDRLQKLATAEAFLASETDPAQQKQLTFLADGWAADIGQRIDGLLDELQGGSSYQDPSDPGGYRALQHEWAGWEVLRGKGTRAEVVPAAEKVVKKIVWCAQHAAELADESSFDSVSLATGARRAQEQKELEREYGGRQ